MAIEGDKRLEISDLGSKRDYTMMQKQKRESAAGLPLRNFKDRASDLCLCFCIGKNQVFSQFFIAWMQ